MVLTPTPGRQYQSDLCSSCTNDIHDWLHLYYYQLRFAGVHHHHLTHGDQNYYAQQEFHYFDYRPVYVQHGAVQHGAVQHCAVKHGAVQHRRQHLIIQNHLLHQIHII